MRTPKLQEPRVPDEKKVVDEGCNQNRRGRKFSVRVEELLLLRAQNRVDVTKVMDDYLVVAVSSMGRPSPLPTMTFIPVLGTPSITT